MEARVWPGRPWEGGVEGGLLPGVRGGICADGSFTHVWLDGERLMRSELASRTELCV